MFNYLKFIKFKYFINMYIYIIFLMYDKIYKIEIFTKSVWISLFIYFNLNIYIYIYIYLAELFSYCINLLGDMLGCI